MYAVQILHVVVDINNSLSIKTIYMNCYLMARDELFPVPFKLETVSLSPGIFLLGKK